LKTFQTISDHFWVSIKVYQVGNQLSATFKSLVSMLQNYGEKKDKEWGNKGRAF
jgi:hypothetical protein